MKKWDSTDNEIAIGYLRYAIEYFNKQVKTEDCESKFYDLKALGEKEVYALISSLRYAEDMRTEQEAYDKE